MFERFANGAVVIVLLTIGAVCQAADPMTPVRPLPPSRAAGEWIEPPAAQPAPATPPGRTIGARATAKVETAAPGLSAVADETADAKPASAPIARKAHRRHPTSRSLYLAGRSYPAFGGGWTAGSTPYSPGFGPAPYSSSGN